MKTIWSLCFLSYLTLSVSACAGRPETGNEKSEMENLQIEIICERDKDCVIQKSKKNMVIYL